MKVNLLVVGFPKCGTSSLHDYLSLHPLIKMTTPKEPHYFSRNDRYVKELTWYESLFDGANSEMIFGESSTSYAYDDVAISRIAKDVPSMKVIVMMRDPLTRLVSHYSWMFALGNESSSLLDAVSREKSSHYSVDESINGCFNTYLRGSNYSNWVPKLHRAFPGNVLEIRSEDLMDNYQVVIDRICDFLEIDHYIVNTPIQTNKTANKLVDSNPMMDEWRDRYPLLFSLFIDSDWKLGKSIKKRLMKVTLEKVRIIPQDLSNEDLDYLSSLLNQDIDFYRDVFKI